MDKHARIKWSILAVMTVLSIACLTNISTAMFGGEPFKWKIRLGLDLQGGTSFVVAIDEEKVAEDYYASALPGETPKDIEKKIENALKDARDRALAVIRNRIDGLGIDEPIIYPEKGSNRIIIQLPGADEKEREKAEESIKRVAYLTFHLVSENSAELAKQLFDEDIAPSGYRITTVGTERYYERDMDAIIPDVPIGEFPRVTGSVRPPTGYRFARQRRHIPELDVVMYSPCCISIRSEFAGDKLKDARDELEAFGQSSVSLEFNKVGRHRFAALTADYAPRGMKNADNPRGRQLAVVLDGVVYSAPEIREPIRNGKASISGSFTRTEAKKLAMVLRSGSLPAPVSIIEKLEVDPSLGDDSIRSGITAIALGAIGILVFMLLYYRVSGAVADVALILNIILLPFGMVVAAGFLGTTLGSRGASGNQFALPVLTLPGIAGILLTIGMAVDANVLIFERIREELSSGKRLWAAIAAGYDRAFVTILDANLTTLLTGIILFVVGSGPIRGFAVTLCAGIMISMFTALVVTKLLFGILVSTFKLKSLRMLCVIGATSIDFISKRKLAATLSILIIVASFGIMFVRGNALGIDFVSGSAVTLTFSEKVSVEEIRASLTKAGIREAQIQYQREMKPSDKEYLHIKTAADQGHVVKDALEKDFPNAGLKVAQERKVDPQVGREMTTKAVKAIVAALAGIVLYVSVRFRFGFAIGAIVALAHDVLITIGIYTLFGRQLSLPIVAALLTIVGYSVNDTIVVFDRIRENIRKVRDKSFTEICNISINQTLSRTILTSFTTLITVVMLLVFGGGAINDFALALCIGVIVGTYSSVFVATPVMLLWHRNKTPSLGGKGQ